MHCRSRSWDIFAFRQTIIRSRMINITNLLTCQKPVQYVYIAEGSTAAIVKKAQAPLVTDFSMHVCMHGDMLDHGRNRLIRSAKRV
jgi:hypothetical protein